MLLIFSSVSPVLTNLLQTNVAHAADDSLVAWWKFDEGSGTAAIDSSGNGYNGTVINASYSSMTPPDVQFSDPYSMYFNPSSSGRIVSTNLSLNNYTSFTLAGWAYPTAADSRASWFGQNDVFEFGFTDSNTLFCYTAKGEASWDFNPATFLNHWHNITCLGDSSHLIIYVDGVNVASTTVSGGSYGSSGDHFSIGAGAVDGGDTGPFSGYIDDVRVYSRALTSEEMAGLGTGDAGPTNSPSVAITSPVAGATSTWNPVVDWADSDTCEYSWNNTDWTPADCAQAGGDISDPGEGQHHLYVRGGYTDGSVYGLSDVSFWIDTTDPVVDAGSNSQTNTSFVQSSATASDSGSGIASYAWTQQSGPGTVTFSNASILNPTISSASSDGTYTLRLTVTDNAGNSAYSDFTLLWDTTSPDIMFNSFPDEHTSQTTATFSFHGSDTLSPPVEFNCKIDDLSFEACASPQIYTDLTEGDHTVTVRATDQVGNSADTASYTWNVDTTPPVITLTGDDEVTVVRGQAYDDLGATANDSEDGDISGDIVMTEPPDTSTAGVYTIKYNVVDAAGNPAVEVTRTVNVVSDADDNGDGIADAVQNNVANIVNPVLNRPGVLEVDDTCNVDSATIKTESVNIKQDSNYDYPDGLFDFAVTCGSSGYTTTVKLYYYGSLSSDTVLRKYNPKTFKYSTVQDATITSTTIGGQPVVMVSYQVTDGGVLDADGLINGVIVDPAGLAVPVVGAPNTGLSPVVDTMRILLTGVILIGVAAATKPLWKTR